jgi:membrane-bound ClpP family serine protease
MQYVQKISILCILFLGLSAFAETVSFQYGSGTTWNGELGQTVAVEYNDRGKTKHIEGAITKVKKDYIYVEGELIFIADIVSISGSNESADTTDSPSGDDSTVETKTTNPMVKTPGIDGDLSIGVFILPMEGSVGGEMRATELELLAEYIDENIGPGQVIVLKVDSGGGAGRMWSDIRDTIFKVRENHRVISWIHDDAISAAAMTVYCCDEIYYTSLGAVGSCSGYRGDPNNPLSTAEQQDMITEMEKVITQSSRTIHLSACMFLLDKWLTYDKDPLTGEITYYDTDEGEFALSTGTNLTLTAQTALDAGLCDGIADTQEELLALLHLEDAEVSLYGVDLFEQWEKTLIDFDDTFGELRNIFEEGDPRATTQKKVINSQIKAGEQILKWAKKLGEIAEYKGLTEDNIKRLKREILDLRRLLQTIDE